jgi:peptidylprolyl isomerase
VALPDHADPAALAAASDKAQRLTAAARRSEGDFSALAKAASDDKASAAQGGDLGWLPETSLIPAVETAVQGMSDGDVSDPIEARDGWHIVEELATRPARPRSFEEVRPAIETSLRRQESQILGEQFVGKLLTERKAELNEAVLKELLSHRAP